MATFALDRGRRYEPGRAPHVCADCTRLVPAGAGPRCERARRQPWAGKTFDKRRADTTEHRRLKAQALQRAGYRCQIADIGCLGAAELELDRVDHTLAYSLETHRLPAGLSQSETGREGRQRNWARMRQENLRRQHPASSHRGQDADVAGARLTMASRFPAYLGKRPPSADGQEGHEGHEGSRW